MEYADIGTGIWVAIIVIGFISKMLESRKKDKPSEDEGQQEKAPVSFEELLREIERAKQPASEQKSFENVDNQEYQSYEVEDNSTDYQSSEELKEEISYYDDDDVFNKYQRAQQEVLESTDPDFEERVIKFKQFDEYHKEKEPSLAAQYAEDLKDPVNIKKAIVLSEILNRKY